MKKFFKIILSMLMIFSLTYTSNAKEEESLVKDETLFLLDDNIDYEYENDGISFILSSNLDLKGKSEYAFILSETIDAEDSIVEKDAFILSSNFEYNGSIKRDAYILSENIELDGLVGRNLYLLGSKFNLKGEVKGDLYLSVEEFIIDDEAIIKGEITINEDAIIEGNTDNLVINTYEVEKEEDTSSFGYIFNKYINSTLNMILTGIVLILLFKNSLFKKLDKDYKEYNSKNYMKCFFKGLLSIIVIPIVIMLLLFSSYGFGFGLIALCSYVIYFYIACVLISYLIGKYVSKIFKATDTPYMVMAIGAIVYNLIVLIPSVGSIFTFIVILIGYGYLFNKVFKKN